ncbi:MAG: 50S ribosomal protein L24 [Candidatus Wildermuthbacteria bacterium GWA2_46_15]|uniref:Large ribosomal subunit protein uL24 n=1 Tax=Candidatus Wildermuthbacteria bacterium GWA2_46_15 TaxID=1802443 RepID=A0A1G2QR03_9BACT|nr:MAG: 50S ribosomal protein L24 [Candidatus Wildermuthbacteria bacterium GWA2_46_15]
MKIKKGDQVIILSGKDRAKKGRVLQVFTKEARVIIEGANLRKKHVKPKKSGEKGEIVSVPQALNISNVKLICPKCGQAARVGYRVVEKKKFRICKKCQQEI